MAMVSYAQNFEDVMLWRALKHVDNGFYIDIGANDPVEESVSLMFYQQGWRGIHVEPTSLYCEKLRQARPDEEVKQIALGSTTGQITFYEFPESGLSTTSLDVAQQNKKKGFQFVEIQVEQQTFDDAFKNIPETQNIHWLKIDVEGAEQQILEGWKISPLRPWILIIESTVPLTTEESFDGWEHLVVGKGYHFAYFDGVNRYYISNEHLELKAAFNTPPNVFDDFVKYSLVKTIEERERFRIIINSQKELITNLEKQLDSGQRSMGSKLKKSFRRAMPPVINYLDTHPKLRSGLITFCHKTGLYHSFRSMYYQLEQEKVLEDNPDKLNKLLSKDRQTDKSKQDVISD